MSTLKKYEIAYPKLINISMKLSAISSIKYIPSGLSFFDKTKKVFKSILNFKKFFYTVMKNTKLFLLNL